MVYLRTKTVKGEKYLYLVKSVWDSKRNTSKQETIKYLGKASEITKDDIPPDYRNDKKIISYLSSVDTFSIEEKEELLIVLDDEDLSAAPVQRRARIGVARTFQKPRLLPTLSVLDNAMLGGWREVRSGFVGTALALPRVRREERLLRERATEMLHGVGLGAVIARRANLLEHAQQRFLEIARGLVGEPRFILLDEPAGGLTGAEIEHLAAIVQTLRGCGIDVLLVEHHTDFVFRICDSVTTLDLGRVIKHGTPAEVPGCAI